MVLPELMNVPSEILFGDVDVPVFSGRVVFGRVPSSPDLEASDLIGEPKNDRTNINVLRAVFADAAEASRTTGRSVLLALLREDQLALGDLSAITERSIADVESEVDTLLDAGFLSVDVFGEVAVYSIHRPESPTDPSE